MMASAAAAALVTVVANIEKSSTSLLLRSIAGAIVGDSSPSNSDNQDREKQ